MTLAAAVRETAAPKSPASLAERVLALSTRAPRQALAVARRALDSASGLDPSARARLERASGHALRAVGSYGAARAAYLRARRGFRRREDELEHAICALGLVDACMYLGRTREALRVADEARVVFVRHRDLRRLAKLETNVGNVHHHVEDLESALRHYRRAARLLASTGTPIERASVDHNRANILTHVGRRRDAEALYRRAQAVFQDAGEQVLAAQVRYGFACLRFLNGEYAAAIAELEDVRPDLTRLGARPLLALADLDLSEVLVAMRLYPEALALARSAFRWFRGHGVPADQARCELAAGIALANLGRQAPAAEAMGEADRIFRRLGHRPGRATAALVRAQLALRAGRAGEAARSALAARATFARAGFPARALAAGALAAEAVLASRRWSRARALARTLTLAPRHAGDTYSRVRLLRVEGAAAAKSGDVAGALRSYAGALREARRAQSALFVDEWRVGFLEGEPPLLDESLGVLMARRPRPRPREVLGWIARARRADATPADGPERSPAVRQQVLSLRAELEACIARLWRLQNAGTRRVQSITARRLEQRAAIIEGRLRSLAAAEVRVPRFAGAGRDLARPPREGEVRLVYFSAAGRLGALRHDPGGWTLIPDLGPLADLERLIRLFHYQMDLRASALPSLAFHLDVVRERAARHLESLGHLLLDPVLDPESPPLFLGVTPYGPLFRVPFHALPWSGVPLIERCQVTVDLTTSPMSPSRDTPRRSAWVIAFDGAGSSSIEDEARAVSDLLRRGGVPVELRIGAAARTETLHQASAEAALIHIAGHAVYRSEHPEFSALRLADGWMNARDLAALPLGGATAVLSACETGVRGVVAGDEVLGLVRGLCRSGASTVLASLWRVDDRATHSLMTDFYSRWPRLECLGAAWREAQRRAASETQDAYQWAAFCLVGEPGARWPARARAVSG